MQLFYYKSKHGNFGDDLNGWLWERLLPGCWKPEDGIVVSAIGTLIGENLPPGRKWVVMSSGAGYKKAPEGFGGPNWDIVSVRGPLTAAALNLPPQKAVTDGAILLSTLPEFAPVPESERHGIVFVPHHGALSFGNWPEICRLAGVEFLSPCNDSKMVLDRLRHAKLVLADAMHAAICADTLRVPWIPMITSSDINRFKWLDWSQSMKVPYEPNSLPPSSLLEKLNSFLFDLFQAGYAIDEISVSAALAHYREKIGQNEGFLRPAARRFAGVTLNVMKRVAKLPVIGDLWRKAEAPMQRKAAAVMQAAARKQPYLSDQPVFEAQRAELLRRVEQLRQMAA